MNFRGTPPIPPITHCLPCGLVDYEALKRKQNLEAWRDREASKADCAPEIKRLAFIAKLARSFPQLNVPWIAEQIQPWNVDTFKQKVAAAQIRYLKSMSQ